MSRTIRLGDQAYIELEEFRGKKETFSEAIERLLKSRLEICRLVDVLEGQVSFKEWQREQFEREEAANRRRDRAEVPELLTR